MLGNNLEVVIGKDDSPVYTLVDFFGDMDSYNIKEKKKVLEEIVTKADKKYLVFSFLNLNYINSESIGLLFHFNELLKAKNQIFVLVAMKKNVSDVLNEIGLLSEVSHFDSMPDFLKSIENDKGGSL